MAAKILVIEDDITTAKTVGHALQRHGYDVTLSHNGSEGLRLAGTLHPDLVILDIMLPGMNGHEVCRYLRSDEATARLPILIFTAMDRPADQRKAFELGADDYLPKPVNVSLLLQRVEANLFFAGAGRSQARIQNNSGT